jgi:NAD dependent epimerase/dehydratase family enzyme
MHRPSWAPVPSFILKIVLGEMAEALVLGGQKAASRKLVESGYRFRFSRIDEALAEIFH